MGRGSGIEEEWMAEKEILLSVNRDIVNMHYLMKTSLTDIET